ncbi:RNA-binding protein [Haloferula rosea]|uniref:RNA-binding protein n=2 Tax=Haloferula rosea TaxID=490093 RepID=A0A934VFP9_9BACT|nr:RNA-binding protein [Haloferula rosea]
MLRTTRKDMKMYVGNLSWDSTSEDLKELFSQYGEVSDVYVPTDRDSGRPRGFAFVTMGSKEAMEAAVKGVDGTEFQGRDLRVNEARPREDRGGGGGYRN